MIDHRIIDHRVVRTKRLVFENAVLFAGGGDDRFRRLPLPNIRLRPLQCAVAGVAAIVVERDARLAPGRGRRALGCHGGAGAGDQGQDQDQERASHRLASFFVYLSGPEGAPVRGSRQEAMGAFWGSLLRAVRSIIGRPQPALG